MVGAVVSFFTDVTRVRFQTRLLLWFLHSFHFVFFSESQVLKKKLNLSSIFAIYRKREAREVNLVESGISLLNH
mgnify:CR=1 FL=1